MKTIRLMAIAIVALAAAGCGGSAKTATEPKMTMPAVTGKTLDVAKSDIKRAGYTDKVEVLGGGTFGIVEESNWTVCEQLPAPNKPITASPRLEVDRTCPGDEPAKSSAPPSTTGPSTTATATLPSPEETAPPLSVPAEYATSQGLTSGYAWSACDMYTEQQFPYGVKLHYLKGKLAERIENDQWFLKAEATITNQFGAEMDGVNVECYVTGTDDNPVVESSHAYGSSGIIY